MGGSFGSLVAGKEEKSIGISDDAVFYVAAKLSLKSFPNAAFQKCFQQSFE